MPMKTAQLNKNSIKASSAKLLDNSRLQSRLSTSVPRPRQDISVSSRENQKDPDLVCQSRILARDSGFGLHECAFPTPLERNNILI